MNSTHAPLNILLADDDVDDRFFFEKALKKLPVETDFAFFKDGEYLMSYLNTHPAVLPDILFLDLNMPRKNGMECLDEIKADERLKNIKVVIFSTSLRNEAADRLYKTGAHYYIYKSDFGELMQSINRVFTLLNESPVQPARKQFVINVKEVAGKI